MTRGTNSLTFGQARAHYGPVPKLSRRIRRILIKLLRLRAWAITVLRRAATAVRRAVAPVVIAGLLTAGPLPVALLPATVPGPTPGQVLRRAAERSNAGPDTPLSRWEASGVAAQKEALAIKKETEVLLKIPAAADYSQHPAPTLDQESRAIAAPKPNGAKPHPLTETERLYAARWGDHPTVEAAQQAYRAWIAHSRAMSRSDTRGLDDVVDVADAMDRSAAMRLKASLDAEAGDR